MSEASSPPPAAPAEPEAADAQATESKREFHSHQEPEVVPPLPGEARCPWRTAHLPGLGGRLGLDPEDFVVEEIPAYTPTGEGAHCYVWIEKRDLTTEMAIGLLARAAGCNPRDVGWAGRKDRHAVTRQWISLPVDAVDPGDARLKILEISRHNNKLKPGHLHGNRFEVRLHGLHPEAAERLPALLEALASGFPNYFGEQRFGRNNLAQGLALARGRNRRARPDEARFLTSTVQSAAFNLWLGARVAAGALDAWRAGDVLQKRESGGQFVSTDADDAERVRSCEVDATGPLPGPRMRNAELEAAPYEAEARAALGLDEAAWDRLGRTGQGARRVARVAPGELSVTVGPDLTLQARFTLPAGSFATVFLGELCHPDGPLRLGPGGESA